MTGLIIRDVPEELHKKLKQQATRHHRSMNKEAIALLEQALTREDTVREIPPPSRQTQINQRFHQQGNARGPRVIVVDTNIVAFFLIGGDKTALTMHSLSSWHRH